MLILLEDVKLCRMGERQVADASKYLFADVLAQGPVDRYWVPRTRPEEDEANLVPGLTPHPRSSPATWQQKISRHSGGQIKITLTWRIKLYCSQEGYKIHIFFTSHSNWEF